MLYSGRAEEEEVAMAVEQTIAVQVTPEGMIPVPAEIRESLGISPAQTVFLRKENGWLVVMPSRQEIGDRLLELMRIGLAGVTQADLEAGRVDDAHRG